MFVLNSNFSANHTSCDLFDSCWKLTSAFRVLNSLEFALMALILFSLNIWVLWLVTKRAMAKAGLGSVNVLIFNQAAAELLTSVAFAIIVLSNHVCTEPLQKAGVYLTYISYLGRPFSQASICVEHYLAVVHPVTYMGARTRRLKIICAGLLWLLSLLFGLVGYSGLDRYNVYLIPFSLTFGIMLFCCLSILRTLIKPKPGHREANAMDQLKMNAFKIITFTMFFSVVGYAPFLILSTMSVPLHVFCTFRALCLFLITPSSVLQPLLYLSKAGKLRWIRRYACGVV